MYSITCVSRVFWSKSMDSEPVHEVIDVEDFDLGVVGLIWSRTTYSNLARGAFDLVKERNELQPDSRNFRPGLGALAPT